MSIDLTASSPPRQQPVEASVEASIEAQPRRRERPVGSKNKPKTATTSTRATNKLKALQQLSNQAVQQRLL